MTRHDDASIRTLVARLRNHLTDGCIARNDAAEAITDLWRELKLQVISADASAWSRRTLEQTVRAMKVQHQLDTDLYHQTGGGRMCINCGAQDYEDGPCDSEQIPENKMIDRVLIAIAMATGEA